MENPDLLTGLLKQVLEGQRQQQAELVALRDDVEKKTTALLWQQQYLTQQLIELPRKIDQYERPEEEQSERYKSSLLDALMLVSKYQREIERLKDTIRAQQPS